MRRRAPTMGQGGFSFPPLALSAKIIMAVNGLVWALMLVLVYAAPDAAATLAQLFYLDPLRVTQGYVHQLATSLFFHDLRTPFHVLLNMLLVYFFAAPLEQAWGVRKTLWFTFAAGVAGSVMVLLFHLVGTLLGLGPGAVTIGFSGAALGMLAVFCIMYAEAQILLFFVIPIRAKFILPITVGIDFLMWVSPGSDISFPAHLGGILFGMLFAGGLRGPEQLLMRLRYWKLRRELDKRKDSGEKVVKGPWVH